MLTIRRGFVTRFVSLTLASLGLCSANAMAQLREPTKTIKTLAYSHDDHYLAIGMEIDREDSKGALVVWDLQKGEPAAVHFEEFPIAACAFLPTTDEIAFVASKAEIVRYDFLEGSIVERRAVDGEPLTSLVLTPVGKHVAVGDGRHVYWGELAANEFQTILAFQFAISPDAEQLVVTHRTPTASLIDVESGESLLSFAPNDLVAGPVAFSRDGNWFAVGRNDAVVRVRNVETGSVRARLRTGPVFVDFSNNDRWLAVVDYSSQHQVKLFPLRLDDPTPDEQREIERTVAQWDSDDYSQREQASADLEQIGMVAVPAMEALIQSEDAELRIRAREVRERIRAPEPTIAWLGKQGHLPRTAFSTDSRKMAVSISGSEIMIWDVETSCESHRIEY